MTTLYLRSAINMNSLQEFVDYVWSFYNPQSELYPIKGLTKKDIFNAFYVYKYRLLHTQNEHFTWGYCDSLDRERVRDIILEEPQFTFGG